MTVPTTSQPEFWRLDSTSPGHCNERLLFYVWKLSPGDQTAHWELYSEYSQEQLRAEVQSNWFAWQIHRPTLELVPWVWALKVYLWRFPLDNEFAQTLRQQMGPMWLLHVRQNDDDWQWLHKHRDGMSLETLTTLLGLLPKHPIGQAVALDIPPAFDGDNFEHVSPAASPKDLVLQQPSLGLLRQYGETLLAPETRFYPRWRALLLCLHYSLPPMVKTPQQHKEAEAVLKMATQWLKLTPRTLWKGYAPAWVDFVKNNCAPYDSKMCRSLVVWDELVQKFEQPPTWQERLRASAASPLTKAQHVLS